MKFPSLNSLGAAARGTLVRFPFVLLAGLIGALAIISETDDDRYVRVAWLGIALLFALALFTERRGWSLPARLAAQGAGIALLILYFLSLPQPPGLVDDIRMAFLAVGVHLLVAFAPFTGRNQVESFWRYNQILFLRILIAGLFTGVLYGGLSLALLSIDRLFDVTIESDTYRDLGVLLIGVFNTWFFLSGVPREFGTLGEGSLYPRGLKIFTQYVLLPLVTVYLVILYLYAAKIVLNWEWPNGWVSSLVIGFAIAGILSALLLWPIRDQEGNRWIRRFSSGFYWALLPLVALLFLAIWRRISDYGITESRYVVIATAFWLAGIALYFIISRRDNIKVIPISLCLMALLGSFGPWGAFEVSINSQLARLEDLLQREHLLVAGRVRADAAQDTMWVVENQRVVSILRFLDEHHAFGRLEPLMPGARPDTMLMEEVAERLGIDRVALYGGDRVDRGSRYIEIGVDQSSGADRTIAVGGFATIHRFERSMLQGDQERFVADGVTYTLRYHDSSRTLLLDGGAAGRATFNLPALADRAIERLGTPADSGGRADASPEERRHRNDIALLSMPRELLTGDGTGPLRARIVLTRATLRKGREVSDLRDFQGYLLVGSPTTAPTP